MANGKRETKEDPLKFEDVEGHVCRNPDFVWLETVFTPIIRDKKRRFYRIYKIKLCETCGQRVKELEGEYDLELPDQ